MHRAGEEEQGEVVCVAMPEAFKRGDAAKGIVEGVNVGDLVKASGRENHVVPAMPSSEPSGRPVGFVLGLRMGRFLPEGRYMGSWLTWR